jgi:hypothetical protein
MVHHNDTRRLIGAPKVVARVQIIAKWDSFVHLMKCVLYTGPPAGDWTPPKKSLLILCSHKPRTLPLISLSTIKEPVNEVVLIKWTGRFPTWMTWQCRWCSPGSGACMRSTSAAPKNTLCDRAAPEGQAALEGCSGCIATKLTSGASGEQGASGSV